MQIMPEFGLAGAETMCENLTYELIKRGHEVIVVSLFDFHSPITERLEQQNVTLIYLHKNIGLDLPVIKEIRKVLKDYRPDIVHTHRYLLKYVAAAAVGIKIKGFVHTLHSIAQKENLNKDRMINGFLFKLKRFQPVALSPLVQKTINEVYKLPKNKIPVVYNGVTMDSLNTARGYTLGERINIIHVGRYTDVKNHLALMQAIVDLHHNEPRVVLHLFGDGELKSEIDNFITTHKADDYIIDNGLSDNIQQKLLEADIFVLPSKYEGIPMTIIEAMRSGLPIVASHVGGIPDMIDNGKDGLLCGTDKESIEACLEKVISDNRLREQIGKSALKKAEMFSAAKMAEEYERIYHSFLR